MPIPLKPIKYKTKSGRDVELYYVSELAHALGRTSQTVRKWEISGIIPPTIFKDKFGRRLYSKEQINVIVLCAEKAKIQQGKDLSKTSFKFWVHRALKSLNDEYSNVKGDTTNVSKKASN